MLTSVQPNLSPTRLEPWAAGEARRIRIADGAWLNDSNGVLDGWAMAGLTIQVKVKPNARASSLVQVEDGSWVAQLKAPPVDGKANSELVGLVARHFGCAKASVSIKSGASGRLKLVRIAT